MRRTTLATYTKPPTEARGLRPVRLPVNICSVECRVERCAGADVAVRAGVARWLGQHHVHRTGCGRRQSTGVHFLITGSMARSAKRRYISYSEADFEVFRPAAATRSTDGGEIWHRGGPPPVQR